MDNQPHKVFYDDQCPLCSKEILHYKKLEHLHQIDWIPISSSSELIQSYGLSIESVLKRIHAIRSDGMLVSGVAVFALIWVSLKPYHLLGKVVTKLQLVPFLDYFYQFFAEWRFNRNSSCTKCD